ncbi:type II secretion system protein [bacterium]|nr:type II secretion system protein [candidate division CSSED10-310 bacterium]
MKRIERSSDLAGKGFTLLEIMVAIAILSLVLVGVMHIFTSSLKGVSQSKLYTEGLMVAQQAMESLLINPRLEPGTYSGSYNDTFIWEAEVVERATPAQETIPPDDANSNQMYLDWVEEESTLKLFEVIVRVSWPETGYPGHAQLSTLYAYVGPEEESEDGS